MQIVEEFTNSKDLVMILKLLYVKTFHCIIEENLVLGFQYLLF